MANFFSQFVVNVLGNGLLIAGILIVLSAADWRLGLGMAIYGAIAFAALSKVQSVAVDRFMESRQARAEHFAFIEERISGTEDIRAGGAQEYVLRRLYGLMREMLLKTRTARLVSNLTLMTTNVLYVTGYALALALGAYLYIHHQVTLGTAYLVVFYVGLLQTPLDTIREQVQDLQQAAAGIGRIEALMREGRPSPLTPLPAAGAIPYP